ncbi:hypothetical protein QQZ08_004554 [Neonectria magnoliae]|uniref:Uncharacterized protein n=1 Tax=Neonectria magnoliae TaxID=2732573 RepID=A0ABR1I5U2_9HYPO
MPVRARGFKVIKPAAAPASMYGSAARGSAGRTSSLSSVAQGQLEQFAQQAATPNVITDVHGLHGSDSVSQHPAASFSSTEVHADGSEEHDEDEDDDMHLKLQALSNSDGIAEGLQSLQQALASTDVTDFSMSMDDSMDSFMSDHNGARLTAADVALDMYGDSIKIDSALCRKLAGETALRDPTQRRSEQKLNLERRSNVEAMLAHITGQKVARSCKNCHKGHGPWNDCVVYDGQMCGSCTNCWFNASGARCTFHENNHPAPQAHYGPAVSVGSGFRAPGYVVDAPAYAVYVSVYIVNDVTANDVDVPAYDVDVPAYDVDVPTYDVDVPADVVDTPCDNVLGSYFPRDRRVATAMSDVVNIPPGERHFLRIEAAAKELGMRIAEYEEFLRTPEGMVDQQLRAEDQAHASRSLNGLGETCPRSSPLS